MSGIGLYRKVESEFSIREKKREDREMCKYLINKNFHK